jgi:hypothetical protein
MKKYKIKILVQAGSQGWFTETIEAKSLYTSQGGYYCFELSDGKSAYYPINNTIIEQI